MLPEPPIQSMCSPYRRLARKAGICGMKCSECDCPALVACVLSNRIEMPTELLQLEALPADILALIQKAASQVDELVLEPDDAHEHGGGQRNRKLNVVMSADDAL